MYIIITPPKLKYTYSEDNKTITEVALQNDAEGKPIKGTIELRNFDPEKEYDIQDIDILVKKNSTSDSTFANCLVPSSILFDSGSDNDMGRWRLTATCDKYTLNEYGNEDVNSMLKERVAFNLNYWSFKFRPVQKYPLRSSYIHGIKYIMPDGQILNFTRNTTKGNIDEANKANNNAFVIEDFGKFFVFPAKTELIKLQSLSSSMDSLVDEHNSIQVNVIDRNLEFVNTNNNGNVLLAQDSNSQEVTFVLNKKYDNISFLDENKKIYVDYIPQDFIPQPGENSFLSSSEDTGEIERIIIETEDQIEIKWTVPYAVTQKAGKVKFALSIIEEAGAENNLADDYIWQTQPAELTILPNIGFRTGNPASFQSYVNSIKTYGERLDLLESFLGISTEDSVADMIIDCGTTD